MKLYLGETKNERVSQAGKGFLLNSIYCRLAPDERDTDILRADLR
jgi:hypothetical protein